ncbi:MAG: hypothetical protein CSA29_00665 [Desulfobacterales bacterium]|nr:MAG: hypothetical protein CSA29_00665 [Desulfobacterales bacterium]
MKITDPEVIKTGEQDLIASIQEDLDPETVRTILQKRLSAAAMDPRGGRIVVHENEIAFQLDFELRLSGSLIFDRNGNLIDDALSTEQDARPAIETTDNDKVPAPSATPVDPPALNSGEKDIGDTAPIAPAISEQASANERMDHLESDTDQTTDLAAELAAESLPDDPMDDDGSEDDLGGGDLDEDINDLLQESRDFWAQKKKSLE